MGFARHRTELLEPEVSVMVLASLRLFIPKRNTKTKQIQETEATRKIYLKERFEGKKSVLWFSVVSLVICLECYSFHLWFFLSSFFDRVINYTRVCLWCVSLFNDILFVRFILLGRKLVLLES